MQATSEFEFDTDTLWVDSILTTSVEIDWREAYGDDCEGWTSYEAPECECGEYAAWDSAENEWRCPECGEEVDPDGDGPMMNYHYPLPDLDRVGGPNEAASRIAHLPLCVVEFPGSYSLALTGGGMDLSWEICEAFVRLGFCPPFRFASDPPKLAGHTPKPEVLAACQRSAEVLKGWTERAEERLVELATPEA